MTQENRDKLAMKAASKVHEAWCDGELRAFHKRLLEAIKTSGSYNEAFDKACMKGGKRRNEFEIDRNWVILNPVTFANRLQTYEGFKELFDKGYITIKRFTARELTAEEQERAGSDYNPQTKEENILRPFEELSAASQAENLAAAQGAVYVYEECLKRGATLEELASGENQDTIGTLIHADWMSRNAKNDNNSYLFVPFAELDDWTKGQDLDVFMATLEVASADKDAYAVEVEPGLPLLDPAAAEKAALDKVNGMEEESENE